ncbi:Bardet-Biedl syndrome 5 protein homolog [Octopus sinensis]|uniref:Bardet-Biedl syndrome 5 protein homolog n=1 Tax=Octopus sinensis TaxID=2607531 RepID=A0A6P7STK7_9MOLL|nr:Bardet-Biedl syndrome 5 protein homolog [Octopus sinensis]
MATSLVWQHRQTRFDLPSRDLQTINGENILDVIKLVEDVKAANGQTGYFIVTNLRVIWHSQQTPSKNISIGFQCFMKIETSTKRSIHYATSESLIIYANDKNRFQFIFTTNQTQFPRMVSSLNAVYKAFTSSSLCRELKLRTNLMRNYELMLLPKEEICDKINGVWNLSCDQGNLGLLYITNIRAVWNAETNKNFNISIPYLDMEFVKIQQSKYGLALSIAVSELSGGYLLGFRVDPQEKLKQVAKVLDSLFQASKIKPDFGVHCKINSKVSKTELKDEILEIIEYYQKEEPLDAFAAYLSDGTKMQGRELEFCDHLGLAMEKLPSGLTLQDLWNVPSC